MSRTLLQQIDRDRSLVRSREVKVIEQLCRITLAADAEHHVDETWCKGLGSKTVLYTWEPGKSHVWPLNQCRTHLGPFDLFERYAACSDEKEKGQLRDLIATESARFMNRYDYPRDKAGAPIGPHRAPRFTIEILNDTGEATSSYFLPQIYGYHEFDDQKFTKARTAEEIEAEYKDRYEAELAKKDEAIAEARREMAELRGMVQVALQKA